MGWRDIFPFPGTIVHETALGDILYSGYKKLLTMMKKTSVQLIAWVVQDAIQLKHFVPAIVRRGISSETSISIGYKGRFI